MRLVSGIGNRVAPPRFLAFVLLFALTTVGLKVWLDWRESVMIGFDIAAAVFLLSCIPLLGREAGAMRESARRNDANRRTMLVVTGAVSIAILTAVASELLQRGSTAPQTAAIIVATLALSWLFSNLVYALHYAHLFYRPGNGNGGGDSGGLSFPGTEEPDYWDFVYFAYCLGMTFQTSDVTVGNGLMRRVVTLHCLAAFVFNLGVIAFTINVLGAG
ncbi:DUF1345 domain-containing protein [Sphingomonas sanxanigenens]|uniref:DUF1345 domain-containing protein n=1 Tax=Sphingomonas sanxanigenens DSM 19645 = NX02 TaxID=1123269 RepID=W0AJR1_9SPHN|nr:DUF1345 domain-containing protein [Sphingomonas sanxanigenens]AHE57381.1 hypothetical protein NX02_29060 [Sphingomonas sanxanigenens DSM 19645 = NX02]